MTKYVIISCLCSLFCVSNSTAQNTQPPSPKKRYIGISLGLSLMRSKDHLASPFAYNGYGRPIGISYISQTPQKHHEEFLVIDKARLTSPLTQGNNHEMKAYRLRTHSTYHRFWKSIFQNHINIFLGGTWESIVTARILSYRQNGKEPFFEITTALHPTIKLQFKQNPQTTITYELSAPLITLIWRNAHSIKGPFKAQLTSLNDFLGINHKLTYIKQIKPRWHIHLSYWGQYYRYTQPRTTQMGIDQISAILYWAF